MNCLVCYRVNVLINLFVAVALDVILYMSMKNISSETNICVLHPVSEHLELKQQQLNIFLAPSSIRVGYWLHLPDLCMIFLFFNLVGHVSFINVSWNFAEVRKSSSFAVWVGMGRAVARAIVGQTTPSF